MENAHCKYRVGVIILKFIKGIEALYHNNGKKKMECRGLPEKKLAGNCRRIEFGAATVQSKP